VYPHAVQRLDQALIFNSLKQNSTGVDGSTYTFASTNTRSTNLITDAPPVDTEEPLSVLIIVIICISAQLFVTIMIVFIWFMVNRKKAAEGGDEEDMNSKAPVATRFSIHRAR
jgi:heme/copper-type cytochrome/quinol oxidase subunit 2